MRGGTVQTDSVIFQTASPSMRMTPNPAVTDKLPSAPAGRGIHAAAASGRQVLFSVYVRKSAAGDGAAYSGAQPRLIVRANPAVGFNADVVLDTMAVAVGNWELLSGSTSALTDDGALEAYVDCDGTTGWINVDDWAAALV
jgi:hypothetical protein